MKKYILPSLTLLIVLFLSSSCASRASFQGEYWFQALGEEGEFVLTADVERFRKGEGSEIVDPSLFSSSVASRAERISLSLIGENDDEEIYPLPFSYFMTGGAVEGNFPKFVVNSSLKFSGYQKVKENGIVRYRGDGNSIYAPFKDLILFTNGDYDYLYRKTIEERVKRIDDETASYMASSLFSVYVFEPETLVDIGFDIPKTVLSEMTRTCLLFDEKEGELVMSGRIETTSDGTARALSTLFKNQIVQEKRRNGEKLDTKALSGMFATEGNVVGIFYFPLSGKMKEKARELMNEGIGGLF
ncbi:MAG: hypothetical protein ACI4S4_01105 [Candidatus Ornithospirochaeta sp.]